MTRSDARAALAATLATLGLTACVSSRPAPVEFPGAIARQAAQPPATIDLLSRAAILAHVTWTRGPIVQASQAAMQCVPYARARSGLTIFGDANTWWDQARGRFTQSRTPRAGAVIAMGGTPRGHLAVVTHIVTPREILVDHANWLGEGEIQTGALIVDASPDNSWSHVYVWHAPSAALGARAYPAQGFIGPG